MRTILAFEYPSVAPDGVETRPRPVDCTIVFWLDPAISIASTPNFHSVWGGAVSLMTVIWAHAPRHTAHSAASDAAFRCTPAHCITTPATTGTECDATAERRLHQIDVATKCDVNVWQISNNHS